MYLDYCLVHRVESCRLPHDSTVDWRKLLAVGIRDIPSIFEQRREARLDRLTGQTNLLEGSHDSSDS